MSYILDALKRSEQERHQERAATINNDLMVLPSRNHQKPLWPYLLLIGLLVNAAVILYLAFDADNVKDNEEIKVPNSSVSSISSVTPNDTQLDQQPVTELSPAKTKALPAHMRQPVPTQKRLAKFTQENYIPAQSVSQVDSNTEYTELGEEIIRPKPGVERSLPKPLSKSFDTSQEVSPLDSNTDEGSMDDSIPTHKDSTQQAINQQTDKFEDIQLLSEMPLSFQRSMPDITFNSHIYSTEPSARRAMINNLYLREGDGFSGMTLKEIGEFYIVLEKQEEIFRMPVLRDWQAP